jgi:uncharacterized protein (TIGR03067 family)
MKKISVIAFLMIAASCNTPKHNTTGLSKLNGNWSPVKEEIGGTILPAAAFQSQKLVINDSNYTFTAESVDKGILRYNGDKMDIYGKEGVNTGKHFTAIYKLENDQLNICYNLSGDGYPESYETKGKPKYFLVVYKKSP